MKLKNVLYVVGSPRSGSTLVYNAICSSNFFNPSLPENHVVPNFAKYFVQQLLRNKKEKNLIFESNDDTLNYFRLCINNYFEKISKKYSIENLALKSILLVSEIHVLGILFPEIKVVIMVRDPRDIITSLINVSKKQEENNLKPQYPRNMKILSSFVNKNYKNFFNSANSEFVKKNTFVVKYEDFVFNHKKILNDIMKKFGFNFSYKDKHNYWNNSLNIFSEKQNPFHSNLWNKPISPSKIQSYKNFLNKNEIIEVNKYCKKIINFFNY